ncbi:MAG: DUF4339 domain-containing protein [Bacteroidetes bacterium]|nr:DUF4339 domain-containing protein [Bacteroidota bacterium]
MKKYYYSIGPKKFGAYALEELKKKGVILADTPMWKEGMRTWQRAESIPEVASFFGFVFVPVYVKAGRKKTDRRERHKAIDKKNRPFTIIVWILHGITLSFMFVLYSVLFDSFSETELVQISFSWIVPFFFSLAGIVAVWCRSRLPWLVALIAGIAGVQLLLFFYASVWSLL